ncbi:restriction endonuclease subunit S [Streptomyces shenzhenensis]|uniref:restriction endonuclease subunit S n=1 Tax=Streptomyces shenzhenensis TaxID=943815 RepID=UPI001F18018F|nr:restriction endonuclease subunit S [Streptomyces shenzhenensis]
MYQTLSDVCNLIVDSEHKTAPAAKPGAEYGYSVGTPHIRNGRILFDEAIPVDEKTYSAWTAREVPQEGDLILSREAPVGQVGRINAGQRICLRQRTVLLRPASEYVNSRYLLYALMAPAIQERMHSKASGSTVPHLNIKEVRSLRLGRLPGLPEQQAVAEMLGALDDKIAVNERIAETSLDLAEALYIHKSSSSQGWRDIRLADTSRWLSGGTPKTSEPSYWDGDIPWISAVSLKSPWIDDSDRKVTPEGAESGTRLVPAGTIIFVVRGMSLTSEFRVGLTRREVAFGQDCKALTPHAGIDAPTLFLAIRSRTPEILGFVDLAGHGTGRLATDRIANLSVRLPDGSAAAEFSQFVAPLADRASVTKRENRALAALRDTLLPQLVTGKLRIKDAVRVVEDAV